VLAVLLLKPSRRQDTTGELGWRGCCCRPVWWLIHLMKSRQFFVGIHDAGSNSLGRSVTEAQQGADIGLRRCRAGIVVHVKDA
jgi:hypothetical protein